MVTDATLLAYVDGRDETAFVDLLERFDAGTGSLFRQCLRLERSGKLVRVGPLVFARADAEAGSSSDRATGSQVDRGTDTEHDRGPVPDDDPFEWVEIE